MNSVLAPFLGGSLDSKAAAEAEQILTKSLSTLETFWLKGNAKFLLGSSQPSVADLSLVCEIMQLQVHNILPIQSSHSLYILAFGCKPTLYAIFCRFWMRKIVLGCLVLTRKLKNGLRIRERRHILTLMWFIKPFTEPKTNLTSSGRCQNRVFNLRCKKPNLYW